MRVFALPACVRRPLRRSTLGLAALLGSCVSGPTAPVPRGSVELQMTMPDQAIVVDDRGQQFQPLAVTVAVASAELVVATPRPADGPVLTGGCPRTVTCVPSVAPGPRVLTLETGRTRIPAASWTNVTGTPTHIRLVLDTLAQVAALPGSSVALSGAYNPVAPGAPPIRLAFETGYRAPVVLLLPLPGSPDLTTSGVRYRLVLDPQAWVRMPGTDRLWPFETLGGVVSGPAGPGAAFFTTALGAWHVEVDR